VTVPDPNEQFPFLIVHPVSGDRAYATDRGNAEAARFQLERDWPIQTGSKRAYVIQRRPVERPPLIIIEGGNA
jgi:hypothetical protein